MYFKGGYAARFYCILIDRLKNLRDRFRCPKALRRSIEDLNRISYLRNRNFSYHTGNRNFSYHTACQTTSAAGIVNSVARPRADCNALKMTRRSNWHRVGSCPKNAEPWTTCGWTMFARLLDQGRTSRSTERFSRIVHAFTFAVIRSTLLSSPAHDPRSARKSVEEKLFFRRCCCCCFDAELLGRYRTVRARNVSSVTNPVRSCVSFCSKRGKISYPSSWLAINVLPFDSLPA